MGLGRVGEWHARPNDDAQIATRRELSAFSDGRRASGTIGEKWGEVVPDGGEVPVHERDGLDDTAAIAARRAENDHAPEGREAGEVVLEVLVAAEHLEEHVDAGAARRFAHRAMPFGPRV